MKTCPQCGTRLPDDAAFCPLDGTQVSHVLSTPMPEQASDPAMDPLLGAVLDGRYRIGARLGQGGMGIVYRATHVKIDKPVALKVLRPEAARRADVVERFLLEARVASGIKHPHVVDISDYGEMQPYGAYYVMELLNGHSLGAQVDTHGPLAIRRALEIAVRVAFGLGAAHARGVVHRDLKPDNVFLCPHPNNPGEDMVKILDFGIARVTGRKTRITKAGTVVGTPEYMSPEQARGGDVDHRSDLYALGVILFEMLTGRVPFHADTVIGTLTAQMFEAPPRMHEVLPSLPEMPRTEAVINRLLAKPVDERPQNADEVVALLRSCMTGDGLAEAAANSNKKKTFMIGSGSMAESKGAEVAPEPAVSVAPVSRGKAPSWPAIAAPAIARTTVAPPVEVDRARSSVAPAASREPGAPEPLPGEGTSLESFDGELPSEVWARRRLHPAWIVIGTAVVVGGLTFGVLSMWKPAPAGGAPGVPRPEGRPTPASAPVPAPAAEPSPPAPPASATQPVAGSDDAVPQITLWVRTVPEGAQVSVDGGPAAASPVRLQVSSSSAPHAVVASLPGYRTERRSVTVLQDQEVRIELEKVRKPSTPKKNRSRPSKTRRNAGGTGDSGENRELPPPKVQKPRSSKERGQDARNESPETPGVGELKNPFG